MGKCKACEKVLDVFDTKPRKEKLVGEKHSFCSKNCVIHFCTSLVERKLSNIKYIDDAVKTQEICNTAFSRKIKYIKYIPDAFKTQEMCNTAFSEDTYYFKYIPNAFKTQRMCDILFKTNPDAVNLIPAKFRTKKMSKEALKVSNKERAWNLVFGSLERFNGF